MCTICWTERPRAPAAHVARAGESAHARSPAGPGEAPPARPSLELIPSTVRTGVISRPDETACARRLSRVGCALRWAPPRAPPCSSLPPTLGYPQNPPARAGRSIPNFAGREGGSRMVKNGCFWCALFRRSYRGLSRPNHHQIAHPDPRQMNVPKLKVRKDRMASDIPPTARPWS